MSTVIKGGTVVTADRSFTADVLIEKGVITRVGNNLSGDETLDASGCYIMPGGIDPHTHLEMPFMGTYSSDDFESGTRAALSAAPQPLLISAFPHLVSRYSKHDRCGTTKHQKPLAIFLSTWLLPGGMSRCLMKWPRSSTAASIPSNISSPTKVP